MVAMSRSQLQSEATRLLVNNLTGDIEADELRQLIIDFADSVVFSASGTPAFRSFSIQGVSAEVDAGFILSGSQTFLYAISDPALVSGDLTIAQAGANLSTTVDENNTSVVLTVNTVNFIAGQEVQFTISGQDGGANPFSRNFTVRAREDDEYLYYGTQASSDASTFDFANESRIPLVTTGQQDITIPAYTGSEYIIIAQPGTETDFTEILIGSLNQIGAFTKDASAFTVNGKAYDAWISNRAQLGSAISNEVITLVR